MRHAGQTPEDAACKATFEFRRAAVVHETRAAIKTALTDLDRAKRIGDVDRAARSYNQVRAGLETLRRYPPSTGSREADLQRHSAYNGPARAATDRSNGKRPSIENLPEHWRDDVQQAAAIHDRPAIAIMALTGCRPVEVRGVKVRQEEERITLEIKGAKYDEGRGIKTRIITVDRDDLKMTDAGRDLMAWLGNREVRTITHAGSTDAFCDRVERAADRAGYPQVSAYSYRHAIARELKTAGVDREAIAARLGHRRDRSQSVYG